MRDMELLKRNFHVFFLSTSKYLTSLRAISVLFSCSWLPCKGYLQWLLKEIGLSSTVMITACFSFILTLQKQLPCSSSL